MGIKPKKVLVVDDDETMRLLLSTLLSMEQYEVKTVAPDKLSILLHEAKSFSPDLIILDIHLKHFNGLEAMQRIRFLPDLNQVKFIITSGEDLSTQAYYEGASYFLLKPYMPSELFECLNHLSS